MIMGSCLCGMLRYEVDGSLGTLQHCHCSMCRKHHGAPFASMLEATTLRWLSGEGSAAEYVSPAGRVRPFCEICGSVAPAWVGGRVRVPAGNLHGELGAVRALHVFVASKASWHIIADALPQYAALPPQDALPPQNALPPQDLPAQAGMTDDSMAQHEGRVPSGEGVTHGSCSCGEVSFSVSGSPTRWLQCHCSRCRRGRSAAHGSNIFYPAGQFSWRTGRERVLEYKLPEAERFAVAFCAGCGGGAPVERDNVPFVLVPAGLFDSDPGARPQAHIHVASRAPWYPVTDGLPQFAELPPA